MANPQLEEGFTRIANSILDALARTKLNGSQRRIIDVIIRNTYGYRKKIAMLSDSYISKITGMHPKQINREINSLVAMGIVVVESKGDYNSPRRIGLNKYFDNWTCNKTVGCSENVNTNEIVDRTTNDLVDGVPTDSLPIKENNKENIKKDIHHRKSFTSDSTEMRLVKHLLEKIKTNNAKFKEPNKQTWCKDIELMLKKDGRSPEEVEQVIDYAQQDEFWKCNILSAYSLRKQFDRLYIQSQAKQKSRLTHEQDIYKEALENLKIKQRELI